MIFVTAANEPTMILMLSEQDVRTMREGRTLFVDQRATKGFRFNKVVVSLHRSDAEAEKVLRQSQGGQLPGDRPTHEPKLTEEQCFVCKGILPLGETFEGKCLVCWATEAKRLRTASN